MRIESIDIRGFGCLVNRRYDFPRDRAAVIVADNETGKSTLAAAILAALCGFPKRRQSGEAIKLSEVYKPWNSEAYAVEMDITAGSRSLRVERDFAKDTFVVRDRETGKDVSAQFDTDLTAGFLHLPREDFQRIAFISGKDTPSLGPAPVLQARLSALVDGSADDAGAETAIGALDSARYSLDTGGPLKPQTAASRLSAAIDDKRRALAALDAAIDEAGEDARQLEDLELHKDELASRLAELDSEYREARLAEDRANASKVQRLEAGVELEKAKASLAVIDQQRHSAKQLGSSILVAGVAVAVVSFGLWMLDILHTAPGVAGVLIGIAVAAAGGVLAVKADTIDADQKVRVERDIEGIRARASGGADLPARSSADIDTERQRLRNELDGLNSAIRNLDKQVGSAVDAYRRDYGAIREDIRRLERELAKVERFWTAIEIAKDVMGEVAEDSRRRWAAALNRSASSILPHLNPDYDDLRFDDNLAFTIRRIPDGRTLQKADIDARLSTGAKDQVYLAVRLACCAELSRDGESIPALLDDPLMAADDSRFAGGMRYLVESFARDHQVILLSCARARHEALVGEPWFDVSCITLEDYQCSEQPSS